MQRPNGKEKKQNKTLVSRAKASVGIHGLSESIIFVIKIDIIKTNDLMHSIKFLVLMTSI
jgi:hypothetical protein